YYFRVVRGTLRIVSGLDQVATTWARQDQRESASFTIPGAGGSRSFNCLMPFRVQAGQIQPGQPETFFVRAVRGPNEELADSAQVTLTPGATTTVSLFPPGRISATLVYPGSPTPFPLSQASATLSGTTLQVRTANSNTGTGTVTLNNLPAGSWDVKIITPGTAYRDTTITGVTVTPPNTTSLGTITLSTTPEPAPARSVEIPPLPEEPEPQHIVIGREGIDSADSPGTASPFRAEGDAATVWRLSEDAQGRSRLELNELFGSEFLIQHPAVTADLGNGLRYVAYAGNDTGEWQLYVQRLQDWVPDGAPVEVLTPGSSDNLSCTRTVFHPRWLPGGTAGDLSLLVSLGDCPNNGFEGLGIDDNPWAVGEIRIWRVELGPGF
ncbi:MAG TPA: hypothetical protein VKU85_08635, partial [bacterium]|nr:hypothetical protein [bacterium]